MATASNRVWRSKFAGRRIPSWSNFNFTDFRGWHSRIAIYDIKYDPFDYSVRLSGEGYNQAMGRNIKGLSRKDFMEISVAGTVTDSFVEKITSEMLIAYTKGANYIGRQHIDVEFLELPLSDNGLHSNHTIEAVVVCDRNDKEMPGVTKRRV